MLILKRAPVGVDGEDSTRKVYKKLYFHCGPRVLKKERILLGVFKSKLRKRLT